MTIFEQKTQERFNFEKYLKTIEGKSQNERRKIEMALLKPEPIPLYKGPKPRQKKFKNRTITLTFPNSNFIKKLGSYIKINTYIDVNTYDVSLFIELLSLLDNGSLVWNPDKKCFYTNFGSRRIIKKRRRNSDVA